MLIRREVTTIRENEVNITKRSFHERPNHVRYESSADERNTNHTESRIEPRCMNTEKMTAEVDTKMESISDEYDK